MPADAEAIPIRNKQPATAAYKLPLFPPSWYLFCESRAIARGPVARNMLGRDIVAFRTAGGEAVVMDARCSHFGANLGNGKVVGDTIQCPYPGWRYGPDGTCVSIPAGCPIPDFARQKTYAAQERHGLLFIFNGAVPRFPLPWFLDAAAEDFAASRPFEFVVQAPWQTVSGQAFDIQHFLFVHDRRLVEPPVIDTPAPHVRRLQYRAEIVPRNWRDRALSIVGGRTVRTSLDVWGGTASVITTRFDRFTSRFMVMALPLDRGKTLCQGIAFGPPSVIGIHVRRYFSKAFVEGEGRFLGSVAAAPERFVESDGPMRDYFRFLEETYERGGVQ
jgi:nitrite reductase/ring-hydroxylating ferredoxin subunit